MWITAINAMNNRVNIMLTLSYDGSMSIARVSPKDGVRRLGIGTQNMFECEYRGVQVAPDPRIGRRERRSKIIVRDFLSLSTEIFKVISYFASVGGILTLISPGLCSLRQREA